MVVTCSCAKVQGQWLVSLKDRMETNGQMDRANYITFHFLANVVSNNTNKVLLQLLVKTW